MGGSNPYIEEVKYKPATKKYKVTFLPSGKTIEVDPEKIPYGHNGLPGSILDISEGIKAGLDHACGGVCACSTCHVIVHQGLETCNEATDAELDELDEAPGITPKSRLGCQTVPTAPPTSSSKSPTGTKTTPRNWITEAVNSYSVTVRELIWIRENIWLPASFAMPSYSSRLWQFSFCCSGQGSRPSRKNSKLEGRRSAKQEDV